MLAASQLLPIGMLSGILPPISLNERPGFEWINAPAWYADQHLLLSSSSLVEASATLHITYYCVLHRLTLIGGVGINCVISEQKGSH